MNKTLRKIICGILTASLCFSNLNITSLASDTVFDVPDISVSEVSLEEESEYVIPDRLDENEADLILEDENQAERADPLVNQENGSVIEIENIEEIKNPEESEHLEESETAVQEPADLTCETDRVRIELTDWWYQDPEGNRQQISVQTISEDSCTTKNCDLSELAGSDVSEAGFDLTFAFWKEEDMSVHASDYLIFALPACFQNLSVSGADGDYYTYSLRQQEDGSYEVIITFLRDLETENLTGTIHMIYSLADATAREAGSTCRFVLQENKQEPKTSVQYQVIFPYEAAAETAGEVQTEAESAGETQTEMESDSEAELELESAGEVQTEGESASEAETEGESASEVVAAEDYDSTDFAVAYYEDEELSVSVEAGAEEENDPSDGKTETPAAEPASQVVTGKIRVSGTITFDETLDGINWRSLVRPTEFDQPIEIVQTYKDEEGVEQTIIYQAQDDLSQNDFYLKFSHDGEGGGDFTIENVPKSVTVDGKEYQVTGYSINAAPSLEYYESTSPLTISDQDILTGDASFGTLKLSLKSQTFTLNPTVVPADGTDNPSFVMNATFTNTNLKAENITAEGGKLVIPCRPSKNQSSVIQVPLGISYAVTQTPTEGYKFDGNYTTDITGRESTTASAATGTISQGEDVTITTVNYARNVFVGFDVNWIDNNRATRPALSADNFVLQYKTPEGDWIDLTSDKMTELGIETMPKFDSSQALSNRYSFTGLPAVDAENQKLSYQVIVRTAPEGYVSDYSDDTEGRRTFTFQEQTDFSAQIFWNDLSDTSKRPGQIDSLSLYRRVENGSYELVYANLPENAVLKEASLWKVSLSNLPRYNSQNQEYDYVLVQGSISENNQVIQAAVDSYKTYYNNGSGSFGNDVALCHNNGKITEVLYDKVDFEAHKVWKDPADTKEEDRPTSIVTLWRYVEGTKTDSGEVITDLDVAYESGKAAQVVFQTGNGENVREDIVSYTLHKDTNETISFTASTVSGLSESYEFPAYDDQGQKYVYFVREALSGANADHYAIKYEDADHTTHENGTLTGGTITNIRREKAAAAITKIWQNPAGLADIAGSQVQMKILASADGGKTYDELTVYSEAPRSYEELTGEKKSAAQTASGFTASIPSGEVTYYVNIYNPEGQPYDMSMARIEEIVTKDGNTYEVTTGEDGSKILAMGNNTYKLASKYIGQVLMGDGTSQYRYKQTNTITADRTYTLLKTWDAGIPSTEYADITSVSFKLERRTTRDQADGTPAPYETVSGEWNIPRDDSQTAAGGNVTWTNVLTGLPRYDEEGYEYYYRATEVSFTKEDGTTFTTGDAYQNLQWTAVHHRTPDQTLAYNYKSGSSGRGYFTVSKLWTDNGDVENRKSIKVRIYYRPTLLREVTEQQGTQSDDALADLAALENYAECTITGLNQYTTEIYYDTLYAGTGTAELQDSVKNNWRNYVVLEYCVGDSVNDGAQPAQYTYGQLKAAAAANTNDYYHLSGTVENSNRMYSANTFVDPGNSSGHVLITNTRTGITEVTVRKTWKDDSNAGGHRPASIQFQIYQDGEEYKNIPATVTVTGAALDHINGIVTVTGGTDNTWSFTLTGLPMFSTSALPHSYDVDEVAQESTGTQQFRYIQRKADTVVTGDEKHQVFTFSFSNTITGTVSHEAYKYWQDPGIEISSRPDLYLTLFRYLKKDQKENPDTAIDQLESYEKYTDYKDQIWKAGPGNGSDGDKETGYNWKITIDDLPGYDENGHEYAYVFREAMNNNGQTVLGTYVPGSETKKFSEDIEGTDYDTYEVFTNTIHDYMTVQGSKTWTGLAGYQIKTDELPDPLISLYRTADPDIQDVQSLTDTEVENLLTQGKITLVDTARLTENKTKYFFPDRSNVTSDETNRGLICMVNGVAMLPKFNAVGKRYTYLVRETIEDPIASQLYTKANANGTLANVFRKDLNRRSITVTKTWSGRENLPNEENKYPSVTYTLYRYEAGKEEDSTVKIETHKIQSSEFAGTDGHASYTFQNLLIYSPTGIQYCYYIVENAIDGYSISYTDEPGITDGTLKGEKMVTGPNSEITITEDLLAGLKDNHRIDIISLPEKWNDADAAEADTNVSAGTTNTYDQKGIINISGKKYWNDYGNREGLRPQEITVTLTRHTNNESGQNNKVESTAIRLAAKDQEDPTETAPYIVWNKGEDALKSDIWQYTIYNLERYAPNGMPYIYTLSEEKVTGYQQAEPVGKQTDKTGTISMSAMTNRFEGSYYVRKNWMDGNNKYNLRPASITVKLQRSTDGGTTWNDIPWPEGSGTYNETTGEWTGLPSVMSENGQKIVSINLTSKYEKQNTKHNSWEYTFTNLPTQDKNGKAYTYRCVEEKIGGAPIKESIVEGSSEKKLSAGAYECRYTTQNETKTVIENTLDATSLVVTKQWEGDQENLYDSRPESLTFVLQKRGIMVRNETTEEETGTETPASEEGELSDWQDVKLADGTSYTFTISASNNWTKTLQDLPVADVYVAEDGTAYTLYSLYFRAVEKHTDDEEGKPTTKVDGAQNYEDVTDYSTGTQENPNRNHYYDTDANHNVSNITNRLILDEPAKSISVTKTWRREPGASVEAALELQYKTTEESSWHSYQQPVLKKVSSTASGSETVTWTDLPKYDRDGNELVYQVVEHPIGGYKTEVATNADSVTPYATEYTFTNIELQTYTVKKIWQNTDYAEKTDKGFTATFRLQQKIGESERAEWVDVKDCEPVTLTSTSANAAEEYTWTNLPRYTVDGEQITYRAVEIRINGKEITGNTDGAYTVSCQYDNQIEPAFTGTETVVTNRMIYGFVNLSKTAAYLAPGVTENGGKLAGVKFDIYEGEAPVARDAVPYVSDVTTDANGNLIHTNGKYGTEQKYLISGTYTLVEVSTNPGYSVWAKGVTFTIGSGKKDISGNLTDTGEHGTAWISTESTTDSETGEVKLSLKKNYIENTENISGGHTIGDICHAYTNEEAAVNLESRGVLSFTKTGPYSSEEKTYENLDTHGTAAGESSAYFGVYLDQSCTQQVAGMVPKSTVISDSNDKTTMILTDKAQDGTSLGEKTNPQGVPYLRAYENSSYPEYLFTLLTGTYYMKELVAPAGYRLDTTIRKAVVAKIDSTAIGEDLSGVYPGNKAQIMSVNETNGTDAYRWSNTPNVVTLYKRDQYGRPVTLKENGYLELKVEGEGNTFPSGETVIRLYQNTETPATKTDGATKVGNITYSAVDGAWMIKGLFDISKTYTLSEPDTSVHTNNIVAKPISFTMDAEGRITVTSSSAETVEKDKPLAVIGNDYNNYYKPDAENNVVVMRDVSRYLKDVALEKKDSVTNAVIPHISFVLYKYEGKDADGKLTNVQSVLEDGIYLTTNRQGRIVLSEQDDSIRNQITGCALMYGLDVGKYYFREIEHGASDSYRLVDDIFFEITPKENGTETEDYSDYATVTFATNTHVSQDPSDGKTGTVTNDPVTEKPKTLNLVKVDRENQETKLANARFTLRYRSITQGDDGSANTVTYDCITDSSGILYLAGADGNITADKPDISRKGSYELKEIQAPQSPDGYMTRTEDGTANVVTMVTFDVNSSNQIKNVNYYDGKGNLVNGSIISDNETNEHISLNLTVKNEKTIVSVAKRNDIESSDTKTDTKTRNQKSVNGEPLTGAILQIFEGTDITAESQPVVTLDENDSSWTLTAGILKENTVYTLHESQAPVGYLTADDIYFKLFGTTTKDNRIVSQLYVWTGSEKPQDVNGNSWSKSVSLDSNILTMVDEAIIAPVDMRKVVGKDGSYKILPGAQFEVKAGDTLLGTARSAQNGYLVWESISEEGNGQGYDSGLIFNADGKRVTSADSASVVGNTMILQQNAEGYTFTETYAPDHAYNEGKSFTVKITAENYLDYKSEAGYNTDSYIDILAASKTEEKTVAALSVRNTADDTADDADLVNPSFEAHFQLYKYDAEHSRINDAHNNYEDIGISGVTFTLSKKQEDGTYQKVGDYTTGENGLLLFGIAEKGTYKLAETAALTGYERNTKEMIFTVINSDYQKTLTYSETEGSVHHTAVVKDAGGTAVSGVSTYDLPNYRKHGSVTLTKADADSGVKLNGVKYTLIRISPSVNANVDKYFPSAEVPELTVETGKTYSNVAGAAAADAIWVTNGKDGVLTITDLQWGTYTLVEQQENEGYILDAKTFPFTISAEGLEQKVADTEKEVVENSKNRLTIEKTALDGITQLDGAQFLLYPVTVTEGQRSMGDDPAEFYTSADAATKSASTTITAGETTIYGLTKGTYVLRETKAPEGYELTKDVIFTMSAQGELSDVSTCTVSDDRTVTPDDDGSAVVTLNGETKTLTVRDTPVEVSLKKVDSENPAAGLAGAVYHVIGTRFASPAADELVQETTDGSKYIILEAAADTGVITVPSATLMAGESYTIHEVTAPDSFELGEDVIVQIETDGTAEIKYGSAIADTVMLTEDGNISETGTVVGVRMQDTPIKITINKVYEGAADMEALEGAVFKITPESESAFAETATGRLARESGYIQEGISGFTETPNTAYIKVSVAAEGEEKGKGSIDIPKGLLKQGQSYVLTEVATSTGYQLSEDTNHIVFTVGTDGTMTFEERTEGNTTFRGTNTDAVNVANTRINFSIIKTSNETTSEYDLTNVQLTLTRVGENGEALTGTDAYCKEWPTDEEIADKTKCATTREDFAGLAAGWYMLTESSRPEGYLQADPIYFQVSQDNKVEPAKTENERLVVDTTSTNNPVSRIDGTNRYLVTMTNILIRGHVKFSKVFSDEQNTPVPDAVFTMYKQSGDAPDPAGDTVIATGLRTDSIGTWNSVSSSAKFDAAAYGIEHANEQDTLSIGLTAGIYYLAETGCDGAYLSEEAKNVNYTFVIRDAENGDNAASSHYIADDNNVVVVDSNPDEEGQQPISNVPYTAVFQIMKTEEEDHNYTGIQDAAFEIWYSGTYDVDGENHRVYHQITTGMTDVNGLLTVTVDKKGWYLLKETENAGYNVTEVYDTFELTDDEYNSTTTDPVRLKHTAENGTADLYLEQTDHTVTKVTNATINALTVSKDAYASGDGIENTRKTVSIRLTKADSESNAKLAGVSFELYKKADIATDGEPKSGSTPAASGTTDENGELIFSGLDWQENDSSHWGEYVLVETKAQDGYHTRANLNITLTRALFTDPDATPVYEIASDETANEKMKLRISKKNADGTIPLSDAVFAIYPAESVTVSENGTVTVTGDAVADGLTTDAYGEVTLKGMLAGGNSYALVETTPPRGYKVSLPVFFTVNKKGQINAMADMTPDASADLTPATIDAETGEYTTDNIITVRDSQIELTLHKKNHDGSLELTDAEFQVTGIFTDETTKKTGVKVENGAVSEMLTGQMIAGQEYTFTETTAPIGYEIMTAVVSVDIYGQLTVKSTSNGTAAAANPENVHTGHADLTFHDTPIEVSITKNDMDETDENKKLITDNPATYVLRPVNPGRFALDADALAGYTFTTAADDSRTVTSITLVTGNDGKANIPSALLIAGSQYELEETVAPQGYELATYHLIFTVNEDGTLVMNRSEGQSPEEYDTYADDATAIKAQDKKISIKINKKDTVNHKNALSGAVFRVNGIFAGETAAKDIEVTVKGNGEIEALTGKLVSGNTYIFTEITPPQGYELDPQIVFQISVGPDGSFTKVSGSEAVSVNTDDSEMIDVINQPVEIMLKKADAEDNAKVLAGAVFTIRPDTDSDFADLFQADASYDSEQNRITVTTKEDGTAAIPSGALIIGNTYVLTETKAPDGYELAGDVKFTVKSDGTLDSVSFIDGTGSGTAGGVTLENQVVGLQVTDKLIDAKIIKLGGVSQERLNGVRFTLEPAAGSSFARTPVNPAATNNVLELTTGTVDGEDGVIQIEKGILKQENTYVLKEISTIDGYYLGSSAKEGVELYVSEDGSLSVRGKTGEEAKKKTPYEISEDAAITVTNPQATKFSITKDVTGNMGDLGGAFDITLRLTESDGSIIKNSKGQDTTTVTLKKDGTYESITDYGAYGIPVGAALEITEPEDLCYTAKIKVEGDADYTENVEGDKGKATVVLNPNGNPEDVTIILTNHKDVVIDVGVNTEDQAPWAALSLILPAIWLAYRYRRKRKGGEYGS